VRVAFANNDDQTARRLSDLLGEATATKEQISISGGRFAMFFKNASVSQVQYARPLLLPSEINRLPADQELILVNGILPILARKIRYYQDARFKDQLYPPIILAPRERSAVIAKGPSLSELAQPEPIGSAL
jgi:type IV secretion system protein VirD4